MTTTQTVAIDLDHVFCYGEPFGTVDWRLIERIAQALDAGLITVEAVALPSVPMDADPRTFPNVGGTGIHAHLAASCAQWLDAQGYRWEAERNYPGGRGDLVATDARLAVECGYIPAQRVIDALSHGWRVLAVPYAYDDLGLLFSGSLENSPELHSHWAAMADALGLTETRNKAQEAAGLLSFPWAPEGD